MFMLKFPFSLSKTAKYCSLKLLTRPEYPIVAKVCFFRAFNACPLRIYRYTDTLHNDDNEKYYFDILTELLSQLKRIF